MPWALPRDAPAFRERYGPCALVAGASEGIGAAFCDALAEAGLDLILVARRVGPLEARAAELRARFPVQVHTVAADLGAPDVVARLSASLAECEVGLLVYNACASTVGPFTETSLDSKLSSLDVNCRGPVLLTSALVPGMVARGRGGILLMSSVTGLVGTALVQTYAATKAFTQILGEGLWEELGPHGIDVLVCAAGATSTPNFQAVTPSQRQAGTFPMAPAAVARHALSRLDAGPLTVAGGLNRGVAFGLQRLGSRRAAVRFMSKQTRLLYEDS